MVIRLPQIVIFRKYIYTNKCVVVVVVVFQENYDRMKILVDELKNRTEKIKLGRCSTTLKFNS